MLIIIGTSQNRVIDEKQLIILAVGIRADKYLIFDKKILMRQTLIMIMLSICPLVTKTKCFRWVL